MRGVRVIPRRERLRDARLTRRAVNLRVAGLSPPEIADSLHTSEEAVEKLLRPLSGAGHVRDDETKRRKEADMSETNEPIRTFEKRLPSLGEDAPPVKFTELANGGFIVDFAEAHEEPIRELAERNGFGDLMSADLPWDTRPFVDLSEDATADLALQPGSYVEWSFGGTDTVAYGQVVSVNEEAGEAVIKPMTLDDNGNLVDTGARKTTVALGLLQPTDKAPATPAAWPTKTNPTSPDASTERSNLSDQQLYRSWAELAGLDAEEGVASLSEDAPTEDATQNQVAEAANLRDVLAQQSRDRDPGPDPETDARTGGLLQAWRRFFRGEED